MKRIEVHDDPDRERTMKQELCLVAVDFMKHGFSKLIEAVEGDITRMTERVEPSDKIYYFVLIAYFLKFTRLYCRRNLDNCNLTF